MGTRVLTKAPTDDLGGQVENKEFSVSWVVMICITLADKVLIWVSVMSEVKIVRVVNVVGKE